MAPTSAFLKDDGHQTFDSIAAQFQLDDEALHTITKQFLEDFRLGLSEYNHPMAMMCVKTWLHLLYALIYFVAQRL